MSPLAPMPTRSIGVQCSLIMAPRTSTGGGDFDITQSERDSKEDITTTLVDYQEVNEDESDLDDVTGDLSHE